MNVLIAILLVILIGVVVGIGLLALSMFRHIKKVATTPRAPWEPPLQAQIERTQMMGQELSELSQVMREKLQRENDAELAAYAEARRQHQPITNPVVGSSQGDGKVHQTNPKAEKILIPEGLSEEQRQVLKDFFDL